MSKIFLTSDNHFSHKNIHKFCPHTRPDADIEVMDQKMIRRWQEQVGPEDDVFALGDFFFCDSERAKNIMNQLTGRIHLIYGNHDRVIRNDVQLQKKFASVQEYKELNTPHGTFVLFHYPIMEWNKMHHGAYHCHGHIHQRFNPMTEQHLEAGRVANVCIDSPIFGTGDYSLYLLEDVKKFLDSKPVRGHHGLAT